jgi:hypothetical protein
MMRTTTLVLAVILSTSGAAAGQGFEEYQNNADGFKITIPGKPTISNATWTSEHGYPLPAHVYTVDRGREHYSITVVDYRGIEKLGKDRADHGCPIRTQICMGNANTGPGFWMHDVRGAYVYASRKFMERDAKLTDYVWAQHDRIEGQELQLTNNADQSRTYAYVAMHDMRLYVTEATVPKGSPPATIFQTSMTFVDKDGNPMRYNGYYNNTYHGMGVYPPPPRGAVTADPQ